MLNINEEVLNLAKQSESELEKIFKNIEDICLYNTAKVMQAFEKNRISETHFKATTGYGYDDIRKRGYRKSI